MARQRSLLSSSPLDLRPEAGRTEPRLWVRRLAIWSEPGSKIRDLKLRPGLNIVWSPDASDAEKVAGAASNMGHGSGKTLLCRLLRYCLGEERFAPDGLRDSVTSAFKDGLVGAEVVVDGRAWAVVRPLGVARRNVAVCDADLDEVAAGQGASTGLAPFLAAVESTILADAAAALAPLGKAGSAWLTALAWLSRDQECRFDGVLDWRSAASESGSPARSLGDADRLEALRVFLRALTSSEQALRREVSLLEGSREDARRERAMREWAVGQERQRLAGALGMAPDDAPAGPLAVDFFRRKARERLASVALVNPTATPQDVDAIRTRYTQARDRHAGLANKLAGLEASIPEAKKVLDLMEGELSPSSYRVHAAEHPTCPVCDVPVDRVLAEGCRLSHRLPNLEEVRGRRDRLMREIEEERGRLAAARREQIDVAAEHAVARDAAEHAWGDLQEAERARDARSDGWYAARRVVDDADRLGELLADADTAAADEARVNAEVEKTREQISLHREQQGKVFRKATKHFDAIVGELVGSEARGRVTLDGNGLHLGIELGGDRSTAAIDSLKVVAFDLAALCMSIEGCTSAPAFLVHDSPREADLGLSMYHRLFELMRALEGDHPLFQYIITTTTKPPDTLCKPPWLAVTLEGMPAEKRLLARDL